MHGDEGELESAGEEPEHQQDVAAMAERLGERLSDRLRRHVAGSGRCAGARRGEHQRERQDQQHESREDHERRPPAVQVDEEHAERREQELTQRARGGAGAERQRAPGFRNQLAERGEHDVERAAGESEPDQHAGGKVEQARRARFRHQGKSERV